MNYIVIMFEDLCLSVYSLQFNDEDRQENHPNGQLPATNKSVVSSTVLPEENQQYQQKNTQAALIQDVDQQRDRCTVLLQSVIESRE